MQTTITTATVAIVLLYAGVFVFDAVQSVTAMTIALNPVITQWVAILAIGAVRTRGYDPTDLYAFAHGRRSGWNVPAVVAWTVGAAIRLLTVTPGCTSGRWPRSHAPWTPVPSAPPRG